MKNTFIGTPMERREDMRFLRGRGEYVDDVAVSGLLYAVILRSSIAHGRLVSIDASAALKRPGVHAVITSADMPDGPPIVPMRLQPLPEFKPPATLGSNCQYPATTEPASRPARPPRAGRVPTDPA